ncbi:MFS transporter [Shewanella surugensis]|uniref:MFS transporter n=1 Tax=Shewanella surugensis TaxID=212020 RepID=A0ABT0L6W3_9GAMM|nr:MFS transporter [Shewanella surugensis]MCL1123428.1 MFS transporter [Shewanella surugensis]
MSRHRFRALFLINFSGVTLDNLIKNVLIIFVGFEAQSEQVAAQLTAIAMALFILPCLLLSGIVGQIADRYSKMFLFKQLKGFEYLVIAFLSYCLFEKNIYLLCFLLLPIGLVACLSSPLKLAMIDDVVPRAQRSRTTTLFQSSSVIAVLLGTGIGGFLMNININITIIGIMTLTLISAILVLSQKNPDGIPIKSPQEPLRFKGQYKKMQLIISHDPKLLLGVSLIAYYWFFINLSYSQTATYAKYQLQVDEFHVTMLLTTMTLAIACGSMLYLFLNNRVNQGIITFLGCIGFSVGYLMLSSNSLSSSQHLFLNIMDEFTQALIIIFLLNLLSSLLLFSGFALLQVNGADAQKAAIFAANNFVCALSVITSSGIMGIVLHYDINVKQLFFIFSILSVLGALFLFKQHHNQIKLTPQPIP